MTVRVGDPRVGVTVGKKAQGAANPALAVPIGLGHGRLMDMKKEIKLSDLFKRGRRRTTRPSRRRPRRP